MSEADELLQKGDLDGARRVLVEAVRNRPSDVPARLFLFQLLAVTGDWTKARTQLTALAQLSPEAQMLSVVYGQAIEAEAERAAVFAGTATAIIHGGSDWAGGIAEAIRLDAIGEPAEASAVRDAAFAAAPDTPGTVNDHAIEWIADADPRFGPVVEAIVGGRYGLLPFGAISALAADGPKDLRDLVWYPVEITLKAGPRVAALLPVRYPGSATSVAAKLARATEWGNDGLGEGQRIWAGSDGVDHDLLSIRSLQLG